MKIQMHVAGPDVERILNRVMTDVAPDGEIDRELRLETGRVHLPALQKGVQADLQQYFEVALTGRYQGGSHITRTPALRQQAVEINKGFLPVSSATERIDAYMERVHGSYYNYRESRRAHAQAAEEAARIPKELKRWKGNKQVRQKVLMQKVRATLDKRLEKIYANRFNPVNRTEPLDRTPSYVRGRPRKAATPAAGPRKMYFNTGRMAAGLSSAVRVVTEPARADDGELQFHVTLSILPHTQWGDKGAGRAWHFMSENRPDLSARLFRDVQLAMKSALDGRLMRRADQRDTASRQERDKARSEASQVRKAAIEAQKLEAQQARAAERERKKEASEKAKDAAAALKEQRRLERKARAAQKDAERRARAPRAETHHAKNLAIPLTRVTSVAGAQPAALKAKQAAQQRSVQKAKPQKTRAGPATAEDYAAMDAIALKEQRRQRRAERVKANRIARQQKLAEERMEAERQRQLADVDLLPLSQQPKAQTKRPRARKKS